MSDLDIILSRSYKEMAGYYNIENISNNTILSGNVTVGSNLNVSDSSYFKNTTVANNLYLGGELISHNDITTDTLFTSNITIGGNVYVTNDTLVTNNLNMDGSLVCNNIKILNTSFNSNLNIDSDALVHTSLYTDSINNTSSIMIDSPLITIGTTGSNLTFNGTILNVISEQIEITDKLITLDSIGDGAGAGIEILGVSGNGYIKVSSDKKRYAIKNPLSGDFEYISTFDSDNNLIISGASAFNGNVTISSNLTISSDILFQQQVDINSNLNISNTSIFNNNVTINGTLNIDNNDLIIVNNLDSNGNLKINNTGILNSSNVNAELNIKGESVMSNPVTINSVLNLLDNTVFNQNLTIVSNTNISNNSIIKNNFEIVGDCSILEDISARNYYNKNTLEIGGESIHNKITTNSDMYVNGNIYIEKNSTMSSDLNIYGKIICPLREFQTNSIAALNNIPVWGLYRTGGIIKVRVDILPPVITLGFTDLQLTVGQILQVPTISVSDNMDEDPIIPKLISIENNSVSNIISNPISITEPTNIAGTDSLTVDTYTMTFTASDIIGNIATEQATLNVVI